LERDERELDARQPEEINIYEELRGLREISPELADAYSKLKGIVLYVARIKEIATTEIPNVAE
jgi:hypothetical protein